MNMRKGDCGGDKASENWRVESLGPSWEAPRLMIRIGVSGSGVGGESGVHVITCHAPLITWYIVSRMDLI